MVVDGRILVVDDDPIICELLSAELGAEGYGVSTVESGEAALEVLEQEPFSLVMLDLYLPGIHGMEVLREIRGSHPGVDVILMTGHVTTETAIEALRLGAQDYLNKPLDNLESVMHVIRKTMEKRDLQRENERLVLELRAKNVELASTVKRLTSLMDAGRAMSGVFNMGEVLDYFIEVVSDELDVTAASVMLMDTSMEELYIAAARGLSEDVNKNFRVKVGEGIPGRAVQLGRQVFAEGRLGDGQGCRNGATDPCDASFASPVVVGIPIKHKAGVLGVVNLSR